MSARARTATQTVLIGVGTDPAFVPYVWSVLPMPDPVCTPDGRITYTCPLCRSHFTMYEPPIHLLDPYVRTSRATMTLHYVVRHGVIL